MRIVGFNFRKFEAERGEGKKGEVKVNSNIDIEDIEETQFSLVKKKQALRFNFKFSIQYQPKVATINLNGFVIAVFDKKKAKEVQKEWKDKNLPNDVRKFILDFILNKCNLKALELEDEFGLPPHIPMPKLKQQSQDRGKKKSKGNKSKKGKSYTG